MVQSIDIQGGGLFQIAEPEAPNKRRRKAGKAIGIDLGTTHSLVAIAPNGDEPRVLGDDAGETLLPSVVAYAGAGAGEGEVVVGRGARALAVEHPEQVRIEHDRAAAINDTLAEAGPDDIVLIAGKGHETVQIIADKSLPFSDRERVMALQREWAR